MKDSRDAEGLTLWEAIFGETGCINRRGQHPVVERHPRPHPGRCPRRLRRCDLGVLIGERIAMTLIVKRASLRRIVLNNGGQVSVGPIEADGETVLDAPLTGILFHRAGEETVRFGLSQEAREALVELLTKPGAGEEWDFPSDYRTRMTFTWKLVTDDDLKEAEALSAALAADPDHPTPTPSSEPV